MGRGSKNAEPDEAAGAPEWMVTFSDCMTLLLTFFVLLLSFSSFDDRVFRSLKVLYSSALRTITPVLRSDKDAFLYLQPVRHVRDLNKGSEKPTLDRGSPDGLMKETGLVDLRNGLAFSISSKNVFWGKGTALSSEGRFTMDTMASFLREVPSRIVISEYGPADDQSSEHLGLPRAWAVMDYLISRQALDSKRFSLSAASTLAQGSSGSGDPDLARPPTERTVEIVLLERSIYN